MKRPHTQVIHQIIRLFSKIYQYSTAQSPDSAYIIGGSSTQYIIAEYKNEEWRRLPDLKKQRFLHGSITVGIETVVIGGYSSSE